MCFSFYCTPLLYEVKLNCLQIIPCSHNSSQALIVLQSLSSVDFSLFELDQGLKKHLSDKRIWHASTRNWACTFTAFVKLGNNSISLIQDPSGRMTRKTSSWDSYLVHTKTKQTITNNTKGRRIYVWGCSLIFSCMYPVTHVYTHVWYIHIHGL